MHNPEYSEGVLPCTIQNIPRECSHAQSRIFQKIGDRLLSIDYSSLSEKEVPHPQPASA